MAIPSRMETTPDKTSGGAAPAEERRQIPWEAGKPRERRRPRWGEFRDAYPRIVTAAAIGMVALLALDLALLVERARWNDELRRMRGAMTEFERRRADALVDSAEDRTALMIELVRRQALADADWVLPGSVRAQAADLDAIAENLQPGVPVYFYW